MRSPRVFRAVLMNERVMMGDGREAEVGKQKPGIRFVVPAKDQRNKPQNERAPTQERAHTHTHARDSAGVTRRIKATNFDTYAPPPRALPSSAHTPGAKNIKGRAGHNTFLMYTRRRERCVCDRASAHPFLPRNLLPPLYRW